MSFEAAILNHTLLSPQDRLGDLFDAHHRRLYRLARRLAGNAEEAHDLVQESFLRAARHVSRLPASSQGAEAWLVRTLINLCRDRYRRNEVRQRAADGGMIEAQQTEEPEDRLIARATVRDALTTLDPRRRAVVVLHELEDRPMRDVAKLLGISPVTARWHLAKARRQLTSLLSMPDEETAP